VAEPVLSGEITGDGVLALLREIESRRTTGVLHFEAGDLGGDVKLVAGQLALEQEELPDGRDPVEVLLELREGSYDVYQRLPPLPVSRGDDRHLEGSLAVHVPADLMGYCERAGLTGVLTLENEGRRAEAVYDRGELQAIRVDGEDADDLNKVFGWEEGHFEVATHTVLPPIVPEPLEEVAEEDPSEREPTMPRLKPRPDATGKQFLKSVEVALASIVEEREKRRSPSRTSPPLPPAPKARRPDSIPGTEKAEPAEPRKEREPTVRIIYLGGDGAGGGAGGWAGGRGRRRGRG